MVKVKQRRGHRSTSAWSRGEKRNAEGLTLGEIGRSQFLMINSRRARLKKCSATAKSTGERCGQIAMENGKCRFHGGRTPKGDQWHVVQPDVSGHKTSMVRFDRKLAKAEKAQKERRLKLMRATDEQRAAYEKWLWFRPAGSAARRAQRRAQARMNRFIGEETRELTLGLRVDRPDPELEALRARLAKLKSWLETGPGVFG